MYCHYIEDCQNAYSIATLLLMFQIMVNPPYQEMTGGGSVQAVAAAQAKPVFQVFVEQAKIIAPRYISMITPARWYAGGIGLDAFRQSMLHDRHIIRLVDYSNSKDCFPTVDIAGGLCYFLWDAETETECEVTNHVGTEVSTVSRNLDEFGDIFIRLNQAISIIHKVMKKAESTWDVNVQPIDCFGFPSKARGVDTPQAGFIKLIHSQGTGYVARTDVKKNANFIDKYKVTIGILVPSNGEVGIDPSKGYRSITYPRILLPGEITTFSYLVLGVFDELSQAENFRATPHKAAQSSIARQDMV